jgi:hypothetical protein
MQLIPHHHTRYYFQLVKGVGKAALTHKAFGARHPMAVLGRKRIYNTNLNLHHDTVLLQFDTASPRSDHQVFFMY